MPPCHDTPPFCGRATEVPIPPLSRTEGSEFERLPSLAEQIGIDALSAKQGTVLPQLAGFAPTQATSGSTFKQPRRFAPCNFRRTSMPFGKNVSPSEK